MNRETPYDEDDGVTVLQEAVLGLLEEAGVDTATNDAVIKLIAAAEQRMAQEPPDAEDQQACDPLRGQRMDSADMGET